MAKKQIVIEDIKEMLENGKTRKEINEFYDLNPKEIKYLWGIEELKHSKPSKYSIGIEIVAKEDVKPKFIQHTFNFDEEHPEDKPETIIIEQGFNSTGGSPFSKPLGF